MRDGLIIETGAMDDGYWAGDENPFHITVIGNGEEKEIEIPSQYLGPFGGYPTLLDWTKKYALFTVRQDDQDIYFLCDLETGDIKKYTGSMRRILNIIPLQQAASRIMFLHFPCMGKIISFMSA